MFEHASNLAGQFVHEGLHGTLTRGGPPACQFVAWVTKSACLLWRSMRVCTWWGHALLHGLLLPLAVLQADQQPPANQQLRL